MRRDASFTGLEFAGNVEITQCHTGDYLIARVVACPIDQDVIGLDVFGSI
jgi:hypothetical protein